MWLINTSTLLLESFYGADIPDYAILSHTWGTEEVSFQEFQAAGKIRNVEITQKAGYGKIMSTCNRARKHGYPYAWIDTCCIDKTSSAELTEAINSMFTWYQQSQICYVYLSDSQALDGLDFRDAPHAFMTAFGKCRWFSRGWCLQELLAPRNLLFVNKAWDDIGTKSKLSDLIAIITNIPAGVLSTPPRLPIWDCPIADRISWIGNRQTTRIEDMAYSLLGILGVNMPMLYGEGAAAFIRLQGEVIRKYNDLSIFAWVGHPTPGYLPILAHSPSSFVGRSGGGGGRRRGQRPNKRLSTQYSLTNQGVFFPNAELRYQRVPSGYPPQYLLDLDYGSRGSQRRYLCLQKIGSSLFIRIYDSPERQKAFRKSLYSPVFYEPVCILDNPPSQLLHQITRWAKYSIRLRWKPWEKSGRQFWHIRAAEPRAIWDLADNQFLLHLTPAPYLHVEFVPGNHSTNPDRKFFIVAIQVGNKETPNPALVSARIVTVESRQGVNRTWLGFRGEQSNMVDFIRDAKGSDRVSLSGYEITMSLELVEEPATLRHHRIYLDWKETGPTGSVEPPRISSSLEDQPC